jgi:hypothetical protein
MSLEVIYDESTWEVHISWTADHPLASQLDQWTEKDFLECLDNALAAASNSNPSNPQS